MKTTTTELVFILDRSGSMGGLESDTIGGFNAMLEKQRKVEGDCRITTVLFDNYYELLHDRLELNAVSPLTGEDYTVRGSTALLDAIGKTIHKIGNVQKHAKSEFRADHVLFVIITDGAENSSRHYSADQIKAQIRCQTDKYGWEFIFLGANIDAVETAGRFGIAPDRAVDYVPDSRGTALNFEVMSETVACYRATGEVKSTHLDAIRKDMKKRGDRR